MSAKSRRRKRAMRHLWSGLQEAAKMIFSGKTLDNDAQEVLNNTFAKSLKATPTRPNRL